MQPKTNMYALALKTDSDSKITILIFYNNLNNYDLWKLSGFTVLTFLL